MYNRDKLLNQVRPLAAEKVPFLDDMIWLREVTARERLSLLTLDSQDRIVSLSCNLLAISATDESGTRLLAADEWEQLFNCHQSEVMELGLAALRLNKMTKEDVDTEVGNSESSQN